MPDPHPPTPAARFTIICPECVRMEWSPSGVAGFTDEPSLVCSERNAAWARSVVHAGEGEFVLDTGRVRIEHRPDGRPLSRDNLLAWVRMNGAGDRAAWWPGHPQRANLGGTVSTLDGVRGRVPLGDGVLARDGWHLLDDSGTHVVRDGWAAPRGRPGSQDWYLFGYGDDFAAGLRALAQAAGRVPLPRTRLLGSWYSRYWPYTSEQFKEIVHEYERHGFPLDVMVLDMDWHRDGWTGWSWNRSLIPRPRELLAWLHGQGLATTLNLHPADGVGPHEDQYEPFMRALGADPSSGQTAPFDAGSARYMSALLQRVHAPLEEDGVDFWWLDWQQQAMTRSIEGLTNLRWLNRMYFEWTGRRGKRGVSFSRWAGLGDHRHPIHFSGDAHTGWESLAFQVEMTATAGNVLCGYWSHDIGGHFGWRNEETMTRWAQFGALSPALRLHSARSPRLDRRPWTCAEPFLSAQRGAFALRSRLMPEIVAAARRFHDDALPLLRPMYLGWAGEEAAYHAPRQYMLGDRLLCAPITEAGVGAERTAATRVWFPPTPGGAWHGLDSGARHEAGREAMVEAAIDEAPVFVAAGVPVLMQPPTMRMGAGGSVRELVVRVYPGRPGQHASAELYEDDGETAGYASGACARTTVEVRWGSAEGEGEVLVGPTRGAFAGQTQSRRIIVELGATRRVELGEHAIGAAVRAAIRFTPDELATLAAGPHRRGRSLSTPWLVEGVALLHDGAEGRVRVLDSHGRVDGATVQATVVDAVGPGAEEAGGSAVSHQTVRAERGRSEVVALPASALAEPPLGLRAVRAVRCGFLIGGRPVVLRRIVESRTRPVLAWRVAGPFPFDLAKGNIDAAAHRFGPEESPGAFDPLARFAAAGDGGGGGAPPSGAFVGWEPARASAVHGSIDFRACFPGRRGTAYGAAIIESPVAQRVRVLIEGGEQLALWVNGVRVYTLDGFDSPAAEHPWADADLRTGRNILFVKACEGWTGWGARLAIDGGHAVREASETGDAAAQPMAG